MKNATDTKPQIKEAIQGFIPSADFTTAAKNLVEVLGYGSKRGNKTYSAEGFTEEFRDNTAHEHQREKMRGRFKKKVKTVYVVAQTLGEDLRQLVKDETGIVLKSKKMSLLPDDKFVFLAVETNTACRRSDYAEITRLLNRYIPMPLMVIFRNGGMLTFAFAPRRPRKDKKQESNIYKEVLDKVSLLCNISCKKPHHGHLAILQDLSLRYIIEALKKVESPTFEDIYGRWWEILNVEKLNKDFYRELASWFDTAIKKSKFPECGIPKQHQVTRMISRLLFVWFMKEKGLVDEELFTEDFAATILKNYQSDGDTYYRAILQNLFFATLNTNIKKRGFSKKGSSTHRDFFLYRYRDMMTQPDEFLEMMKQIPFVNGGLFDCLDDFDGVKSGGLRVDCFSDNPRHQKQLRVPNNLFFGDDGIFRIFNRYKFTMEESTPIEQEVALDPELLGQVFERFLERFGDDNRKQTGSYYTPRVIVDYMVRESLLAYFYQKIESDDDTLRQKITDLLSAEVDYDTLLETEQLNLAEAEQFISNMGTLRILDPAVGSGAFPMGALQQMTMALTRIGTIIEREKDREIKIAKQHVDSETRERSMRLIEEIFSKKYTNLYDRKRSLIRDCLFGVDLQPIAVQICRLRFFISLIIEQDKNDDDDDNYGIAPLPNMDTKIIAANTLIKISSSPLFRSDKKVKAKEAEIQEVRKLFFNSTKREEKHNLRKQDRVLRNELAELLKKREYEKRDADKIAQWDLYDQNTCADWFDPQWMFGVADGFDVVIGNPPYIQLQKDRGRLANVYTRQEYETFTRSGDIYCLFYERGVQLSKSDGHLCYITSNKWMRARYGAKTRRFFVRHNLLSLIDLGFGIFDAAVDTNILLLQNAPNKNQLQALMLEKQSEQLTTADITKQMRGRSVHLDIASLSGGVPWFIGTPEELLLKNKIEKSGIQLKSWDVSIYMGVKTGCTDAFIISEETCLKILEDCANKAERERTDSIIKPVLRGRDIKRYHYEWANQYLINTHNGYDAENQYIPPINIKDYPAIKKWLDEYQAEIEKRQDQGNTPYNLRSCAYLSRFEEEKIVWSDISTAPTFALLKKPMFFNNTAYMIVGGNLSYLLGVLNSSLIGFYFPMISSGLGEDASRYFKIFVENIPIPKPTPKNSELVREIEGCVEKIFAAKARVASGEVTSVSTRAFECQIDKAVYKLYDLTKKEIALVEGKTLPASTGKKE